MVLLSTNSATNFSDLLSIIHFFFVTRAAKKKFPKRNGECAQAARLCYAQSATFVKVDETISEFVLTYQ